MLLLLSIIFIIYTTLLIFKLPNMLTKHDKCEDIIINILGSIYFILLINDYDIYGISIISFALTKYLNVIHPKSTLYLLLISNLTVIITYVLHI
jgi:hypothetical protein